MVIEAESKSQSSHLLVERRGEGAAATLCRPPASVYTGFNPGGTIDLPEADERSLVRGWCSRLRRPDGPGFRWALYPEACVLVPLEDPIDLPVVVTARAPRGAQPQVMTLAMNGHVVGTAPRARSGASSPSPSPARTASASAS